MIVKEAVFETCNCCGWRKRVGDDVRGCDVCRKEFSEKEGPPLNFTVFRSQEKSEDIDCCSWLCALTALRNVESDYFVSLPYLYFDSDVPEGARAQDFFTAIEQLSQSVNPTHVAGGEG